MAYLERLRDNLKYIRRGRGLTFAKRLDNNIEIPNARPAAARPPRTAADGSTSWWWTV
jgi:hypothetical protein